MHATQPTQYAEVNIDMSNFYDPEQYSRMPRELMLAQKIKRVIHSYQSQGWQTVHINFEAKGAKLKFRRMD